MHDENDFLGKLLDNPADDTARLVYADWLDERGDEESKLKSAFLRLTVRLREPKKPKKANERLLSQLQLLAAKLPTEWLAVVSRLKIDYCGAKRAEGLRYGWLYRQFEFVCDQEWADMTPTADAAVRHCSQCKENVHYCGTITEAREHARQSHCVAVDLGIIRRDNDLAPASTMRGRIRPGTALQLLQQEQERLSVDDVSREREKRKKQKAE